MNNSKDNFKVNMDKAKRASKLFDIVMRTIDRKYKIIRLYDNSKK